MERMQVQWVDKQLSHRLKQEKYVQKALIAQGQLHIHDRVVCVGKNQGSPVAQPRPKKQAAGKNPPAITKEIPKIFVCLLPVCEYELCFVDVSSRGSGGYNIQ